MPRGKEFSIISIFNDRSGDKLYNLAQCKIPVAFIDKNGPLYFASRYRKQCDETGCQAFHWAGQDCAESLGLVPLCTCRSPCELTSNSCENPRGIVHAITREKASSLFCSPLSTRLGDRRFPTLAGPYIHSGRCCRKLVYMSSPSSYVVDVLGSSPFKAAGLI